MSPLAQRRTGAILAGLAVALGAFGAHALEATLIERGHTDTWQTAVHYQLAHGLALLLCSALGAAGTATTAAAWCFASGSVVFSGTLYVLALTGPRWLGAVTPIGGVLLLIGWFALAVAGRRDQALR